MLRAQNATHPLQVCSLAVHAGIAILLIHAWTLEPLTDLMALCGGAAFEIGAQARRLQKVY